MKLFETKIQEGSPKVTYRKNETANFVRSRTTLERPLLKLKSRFEKNQLNNSSRSQSSERSHHDDSHYSRQHQHQLHSRLSGPSSRVQSHTRSMPDVSIEGDLQWTRFSDTNHEKIRKPVAKRDEIGVASRIPDGPKTRYKAKHLLRVCKWTFLLCEFQAERHVCGWNRPA